MRSLGVVVLVLALSTCGALRPPGTDGGTGGGGGDDGTGGGSGGGGGIGGGSGGGGGVGGGSGGGSPSDGGLTGTVTVEPLYEGRSRLGARSASGFRPWRGGVAVVGGALTWVESGTASGLYRAPLSGCDGGACVERVATLTRPSAFAATATEVLVADVTALRRYSLDGGAQNVATGASELVTLATDGTAAFWTTQSAPINRTPFGGVTSTPINSNGTPWVMTVAGPRVHWVGVDISGLQGGLQSMRTDGSGARADSSFSGGFQTMRGDAAYLYYARDFPSLVFRQTLSNARLEQVANNAQGVKDFALDGTHAWWVEPGDPDLSSGVLMRVAHESTLAEEVATALPYPVALTVHEGVVYVLCAGTQSASWSDGRILRVSFR
ncbi:MAG: hypothetical protein IT380_25300 [Myxococcales bacterium]|nr:hypothetical protein [Myxococcales bacterium]